MAFTDHIKVLLGLDTKKFKEGLVRTSARIKSFAKSAKGYLSGLVGTALVIKATKDVINFGASIGDLSDRLGVSSEFLQKFQYASSQAGVGTSEASIALQRFLRRASEAKAKGGELADILKQLGVEFEDTNGNALTGEQMFLKFADGLGKVQDPSEKLRLAFKFLDTEGVKLVQLFKSGKGEMEAFGQEAKKLGMILSNDAVKALQDASGKIEVFDRAWKVMLGEVAPEATSFLVGITAYLKTFKVGISNVIPAIELFGKTMWAIFDRVVNQLFTPALIKIEKLKKSFLEFAGLENTKIFKNSIKELERLEKREKEYAKLSTHLYNVKREVLNENLHLQHASIEAGEDLEQVNNLINTAIGSGTKAQIQLNEATELNQDNLDQILGKRTQEEISLERIVERQKALAQGGLDALQVVQSRIDMEDKLLQLMETGNLSRDEAEKKMKTILDAEQQELQLQEQIALEKEKQVALKEKKEDREGLLADLQKEIDARTAQIEVQKQLFEIDQQIEQARKNGNGVVEQQLEQKRIQIQLAGQEFDQRQQMQGQLQDELDKKKQIREFAQKELDAMQARANGFDDIADRLEFQMKLEKDVQAIAEAQNITQEEALRIVHRRLGIEAQMAGQRIQANRQQLIDLNVIDLAEKKVRDAKDFDEKKRIQAAQAVQRLNKRIAQLREKGGAFSEEEIRKLEALKAKKLDIVLDDKTKEELKKLEVKEQDLKNEQDMRLQEMKKEFQKIKDEEAKKKIADKEQLDALEKKKQELLDEQKKVATELKTSVDDQAEVIAEALHETGNTIKQKLDSVDLEAKAEFSDSAKMTLSDFVYNFSTAISSISIPKSIKIKSDEYGMKIDTEGLATESTLSSISQKLEGKLRNE